MNGYSHSSPSSTSTVLPTTALDLSSLTDDDLFESESAWLNSILSVEDTSPNNNSLLDLDTKLAQTLALLERATSDTSALVDRTIEDISRSVPRLTFDLQLMRENALLLQFTLDGVKKRGSSLSGGTSSDLTGTVSKATGNGTEGVEVSQVMEKLRVLDLVKSRMEAARDVLREAESWSTLESEVTALVGEQAYSKAAERLEEAARSMIVFQNTTEYEGRRALMVSLQNQLEASLSASLVAAINNRDVKACKAFYGIFVQIQREIEFTAYYFGSRRSSLVEGWTSANLSDCGETPTSFPDLDSASTSTSLPPPIKLSQFLPKFYSDLHFLINEERTYVPAIFPIPAPILSSFIQTTLEGLSPSLPQRLSAISDRYGPLALPELIVAYKATEEFAISVDRIMSKVGSDNTASNVPAESSALPSPALKKERRLSKRMSISKRSSSFGSGTLLSKELFGSQGPILHPWETAIFEPFLNWQVEYPELESKYLKEEIERQTGGQDIMYNLISGDSQKGAKELLERTISVLALAEDAIGRALSLTHGYAVVGLVSVIDQQFNDFIETRKRELTKARKGGAKARPVKQSDDEDEAALEGLEYSSEDWGTFQFGLKLLDTCRSITERLGAFETKLKSRLLTLAQTVKETRNDPLGYTIPGTTRGAVTLLRQSDLNSVGLATLLGSFEKVSESIPLPSISLLPRAKNSALEFTRSTQLFLHDTILAPLLLNLRDYSSLAVWAAAAPVSKGAYEIAIPTFSLSPSDTISRVGEGLFNLPRLFEVYADDDSLAFSLETLPFVDIEALRALNTPTTPSITSPATPRSANSHRMSFIDPETTSPNPSSSARRLSHSSQQRPSFAPVRGLSAETVIATWLSSLTLAILSHLTSTILPSINRLSKNGASQLASDLGYLSNVARALDVESPEFEAWRDISEMDEPRSEEELGGEIGGVERKVYNMVARMRGWKRS